VEVVSGAVVAVRSHVIAIQCAEDMADKEETEKTIAEDLVVTKYKMAGEIVNRKETVFV